MVMPRERFIERDSPLGSRVVQVVNSLLGIVFWRPLTATLVDVGVTLLLVWVATGYTRDAVGNTWASLGIVVVLFLLVCVNGWFMTRHAGLLESLLDGPPAFGRLGGGRRSIIRTAIRTSRQLRVDLDGDDREVLDLLTRIDLETTETVLKQNFLDESPEGASEDETEAHWSAVWEREVLDYHAGDATLRETFGPPSYASVLIAPRLVGVRALVSPGYKVFAAVLIFCVYRYLGGHQSLLAVLQIGIAFSLTLSMLIYLNHSTGLGEIEIVPASPSLPQAIREQAEPLVGRRIVPTRVALLSGYFESVGRYFLRLVAFSTLYNALLALCLIGISLAVGLAFEGGERSTLLSSYRDLAVAVAVIPFAIMACHFAAALLVQHLRQVTATVVGGLVTALLPLAVQYLASGSVSTDAKTAVTSAISGAVGAIATAVGTLLTNRLGGSPEAQKAVAAG